jgi:hypothetical protein
MRIDASLNVSPANGTTGLLFEVGPLGNCSAETHASIGVDYPGPYWAQRKLRFKLINNCTPARKEK